MVFSKENLYLLSDEIDPLLESHKAEVVFGHEKYPVDLRWDTYATLERQGVLQVYAAREDGKLVGYIWMVVDFHMHCKGYKSAHCEMLYLAKPARRGMAGVRFIRFVEDDLRRLQVEKVCWAIKPQADITKIMYRMGYGLEETVVSKFLN